MRDKGWGMGDEGRGCQRLFRAYIKRALSWGFSCSGCKIVEFAETIA